MLTVVGLLRLRRQRGAAAVPLPGFPLVALVFIATTLGALGFMVARQPTESLWGLATLALGVPLYAWTTRRAD